MSLMNITLSVREAEILVASLINMDFTYSGFMRETQKQLQHRLIQTIEQTKQAED